jgi:hypothetical protein
VELRVYDLSGALVAQWAPLAGSGSSQWDLRGAGGQRVSAGIYVVEARYRGPGTVQSVIGKLAVRR